MCFVQVLYAQGTQTSAVRISDKTQVMNNKKYYIHIVEQGQTVFSIARAYGLKYYDAVIKSDIHQLKVGDTVWLPFNEYSVAAVSAAAEAQMSTSTVHYIKVNAGQTLYGLAREYGTTVEAIVEANPELRHEQLKAGQMLRIPPRQTSYKNVEKQEEKAEPAKPIEPAKPVAEPKKSEPAKTIAAPAKPAETAKPAAEPAKPVTEPKKPEPAKPAAEPSKPAETAKPAAEPAKLVTEPKKPEPAKAVAAPAKPAETAKPAAEPAKPVAEPKKPETAKPVFAPAKPAESAEPVKPAVEPAKAEMPKTEEKIQPAEESTITPGATLITNVTTPAPSKPAVQQPQASVAEPQPSAQPAKQNPTVITVSQTAPLEMEYDPYAKIPFPTRPVQNPYPFDEVPGDFPTQQAAYYNFTTPSSFGYQVRELHSKNKVYITVVMPLNLDKINEISTSKFDIEQRGKKEYKIFEFVQFYEGLLIALDELQDRGYNVVLNVVDLSSEQDADVVKTWEDYNIGNSDLVIALLVKKPFDKLSELARANQVFVINPFSLRSDVVKSNPYVVKYMPSTEGVVKSMLDVMSKRYKGGNLYLLHSNNKSVSSNEKEYFDEFQRQLANRKDIKYTLFDWSVNSKLVPTLKSTDDNVIISIYNQDNNRNTVFATTILNRLSTLNTNVPVLMTTSNWLVDYQTLDFEQLQHLNYTPLTTCYLDYYNPRHKQFIDTYKSKFKTEPNGLYAGVAHDIMYYFVSALSENGAEFWRHPEAFAMPTNLLFPLQLKQCSPTGGYENQCAKLYQMQNYRLQSINY